jgi:hypothetical protein
LFECLSYCIFSSKVSSSSFSIVNTLLKKSANISAFSPSSEAIVLIPSRLVCVVPLAGRWTPPGPAEPELVNLESQNYILNEMELKLLLQDFSQSILIISRIHLSGNGSTTNVNILHCILPLTSYL